MVLEWACITLAATAVESGGAGAPPPRVVVGAGGLIELYDAWLEAHQHGDGEAHALRSLHECGDTEQQLFDALPALTREARADGQRDGGRVERSEHALRSVAEPRSVRRSGAADLSRDLAAAACAAARGREVSIVVPEAVAGLPGLRELLRAVRRLRADLRRRRFRGGRGFVAGSAAKPQTGEPVRLLRRLPLREQSRSSSAGVTRAVARRAEPPATRRRRRTCCSKAARSRSAATRSIVGRAPGASRRCHRIAGRARGRVPPPLHIRAQWRGAAAGGSQPLRHVRERRARIRARAHPRGRPRAARRARRRAVAHRDRRVGLTARKDRSEHAPAAAASKSSACRSSTASAAVSARSSCSTRSSARRAASTASRNTDDLRAEVNRLEEEVLDRHAQSGRAAQHAREDAERDGERRRARDAAARRAEGEPARDCPPTTPRASRAASASRS